MSVQRHHLARPKVDPPTCFLRRTTARVVWPERIRGDLEEGVVEDGIMIAVAVKTFDPAGQCPSVTVLDEMANVDGRATGRTRYMRVRNRDRLGGEIWVGVVRHEGRGRQRLTGQLAHDQAVKIAPRLRCGGIGEQQ